jgi:hypothetical protein
MEFGTRRFEKPDAEVHGFDVSVVERGIQSANWSVASTAHTTKPIIA